MTKQTADMLILLMPEEEAAFFTQRLFPIRPELVTSAAPDKATLQQHYAQEAKSKLLFGFLTDVIVPEAVLSGIQQALNIHPGPPWMPGYRPTKKIVQTGERDYGATLHAMAKDVDTGPILAVRRFRLPQKPSLEQVEKATYQHCLQLALDHLELIAGLKKPTPHPTERWGQR